MSQPLASFRRNEPIQPQVERANLASFLNTPEGLEFLADVVRKARELIAPDADPSQMEAMRKYENQLRAYSAGPLPAELEF